MKMDFRLQLLIFFITGFVALGFQIISHRYFSYLLGGDALAFSLIITLFLVGLGVGASTTSSLRNLVPRSWGDLKIVGALEVLVGALGLLQSLSFNFFYDLNSNTFLKSLPFALSILLMTSAMGAGFNLLNSRWVEKSQAQRVRLYYAINNIGALLGCLMASLYFVHTLGLQNSSLLLSTFSIFAGFLLAFGQESFSEENSQPIKDVKAKSPLLLPRNKRFLMAFMSGIFFVSIESLVYRLLKISIGPTYYLNAMAVGSALFTIGISNLIWNSQVQLKRFFTLLLMSALNLILLWLSSPWWPQFFVYLKTQLPLSTQGFYAYLACVFFITTTATFILYFPLSRLFTMAIISVQKMEPIPEQIGKIYLFNILGSFLGGIFLSSLLLKFMDLQHLVAILALLIVLAAMTIGSASKVQKGGLAICLAIAGFVLLAPLPRVSHFVGVSMNKELSAWTWQLPQLPANQNLLLQDDGIYASVSVLSSSDFKSLFIDNKSDGNSSTDLSTMVNLALIPYLFHSRSGLKTAVVGLGTGITAGVLGHSAQVKSVDVLEIAAEVIDAAKLFSNENLNALENLKLNILQQDALPFFQNTSNTKAYDLIVAEPSNPWVSGNENLFSSEIFKAYKKSLTEDGLLAQWLHLYSLDMRMFMTVLNNIKNSFQNVEVYGIGTGDVLFLASNKALPLSIDDKKFHDNALKNILLSIGWEHPQYIHLQRILSTKAIDQMVHLSKKTHHDLDTPTLSVLGSIARHRQAQLNPMTLIPREILRHFQTPQESAYAFQSFLKNPAICLNTSSRYNYFCQRSLQLQPYYELLGNTSTPMAQRVSSYTLLRDEGLIEHQISFIEEAANILRTGHYQDLALAKVLIEECAKERNFLQAKEILQSMASLSSPPKEFSINADNMIRQIQFLQQQWLR